MNVILPCGREIATVIFSPRFNLTFYENLEMQNALRQSFYAITVKVTNMVQHINIRKLGGVEIPALQQFHGLHVAKLQM